MKSSRGKAKGSAPSRGRSTIGENPLDQWMEQGADSAYHPLDAILPPREAEPASPAGRDGGYALMEDRVARLEERLRTLETRPRGSVPRAVEPPSDPCSSLRSEDGRDARLNLYDAQGNLRMCLGLFEGGKPRILLHDEHGRTRASLDVEGTGSPGLNLYDAEERLRVAIDVLPDGTPGVVLFDDSGRPFRHDPKAKSTEGR